MLRISEIGQRVNGFIRQGHTAWVRELIQQGFDVNEVITSDGTALHLAVENDHNGICALLIAHGADVNFQVSRDGSGKHVTPLHLAAFHGNVRIARMLLDAGADVNARTGAGITPLHVILERGVAHPCWLTLVKEFLDRGANPDAVATKFYGVGVPGAQWSLKGMRVNPYLTPLHVALHASAHFHEKMGRDEGAKAVELLLKHGADSSIMPARGFSTYLTPLQMAAKMAPAADLLLLLGSDKADVGQKSLGGRSLRQLAGNRPEVAQILRSAKTISAVQSSLDADTTVAVQPSRRPSGLAPL